jgi:HK97 family phage portal protein
VSLEDPNVPLTQGFTLLEALGGGIKTISGVPMNADKAMTLSAVWAAISQIAGTVGSLKLKLYRRLADGGKMEFMDHPVWDVLRVRANPEMTAVTFRETGQGQLLTRGNALAEIVKNRSGQVVELWPLPPQSVRRVRTASGSFYEIEDGKFRLPGDRVLHVIGLSTDAYWGVSPVTMARESLALGVATEKYGAAFFGNSAMPLGFLEVNTSNQEGLDRARAAFEGAHGGTNRAHRVAVMPVGAKYHQVGLTSEDAQFLESRKFQVREIARWFNIPPHKIRDMEQATFSNVEEQNIEYIQDTIEPWLRRWEDAMNAKLLSDQERREGLFIEFNVDARLRGDTEKRGGFYQTRFNTGSITPNEIRKRENDNPYPGGDKAYIQVNMIPLDQAEKLTVDERVRLIAAEKGLPVEERSSERSVGGRLRLVATIGPVLADAFGRVVRGEVQNLRKGLEKHTEIQDFLRFLERFYFGDHPAFMLRVIEPVLRPFARAIAEEAREEMGSSTPVDVTPFSEFYLQDLVNRYSAGSRYELLDLVNDAGDGYAEVLDERFGVWIEGNASTRTRAEQYADQESHQMSNAVARTVFGLLGAVALRWVTVGDTCPYCRAMSGRRVGIQDPFFGSGQEFEPEGADSPLKLVRKVMHPPLHRGCDCYVTVA